MHKKTARLTILIDLPTKKKLEDLSETVDLTVSQILRKLIKNHLSEFDQPISFSPEEITRDDAFPLN
ncbi:MULTISPECIES: hypothetical protein [unclassified Pseudomonas]|uniref:hypothetical protein n=1 Tax=unclassified Pseudomonas TaxID=196821 RepID=UPI000BA49918|nr:MULTISPECIES: hypothetical protein [unclassified Pseudomonas]MDX9666245.1 hypothetical protein [Pseudomonas sp. P5_152]QHC98975.1 hypothetical protein PspS04_00790 [Pseudomonas sp. S04]QHF31462.1 hypothetical protein PspS19_00790 [Pseudomonas sp. S19]